MNKILITASIILLSLTAISLFFFTVSKYKSFRGICIWFSRYLFFISSLITFILIMHQNFYGKSSDPNIEISKIYFPVLFGVSGIIWAWSSIIDQYKETDKTWRSYIK